MGYRREPRAQRQAKPARFPESQASAAAEQLMRDAMATAAYAPSAGAEGREEFRPTVCLSLREDGGLQVEVLGEPLRRTIALHDDASIAMATIHRILAGQANAQRAIGLDGAPTQAQVKAWQRMALAPDYGRNAAGAARSAPKATIPPRGKLATATTRTAEELGL